jgi:hypothetical protein
MALQIGDEDDRSRGEIERLKDELHQERTLNVTLAKQVEAAAEKCNRLWKIELLLELCGYKVQIDEAGWQLLDTERKSWLKGREWLNLKIT